VSGETLDLVARQVEEEPTLLLPFTGELVDLREPWEVARALQSVRDFKRRLDELRELLTGVLRLESQRQGTKTLHLDGMDAIVGGGPRAEYDAELLMSRLRGCGLPEERIAQAVVATVTYKPNAAVLKQLAAANDDYRRAIDASRAVIDAPYYVSVKPTTKGTRR
jgi:hypothetical protein